MARKKNKTSEAQLQAAARYHAQFTNILFRVRKDGSDGITPELLKEAAAEKGETVNYYIIESIRQRMARF